MPKKMPNSGAHEWPKQDWSPQALDVLCGHMLASLGEDNIQLFLEWVLAFDDVHPLCWMTACSGTDSPDLCFQSLSRVMKERFPGKQVGKMFRNVAAAELDDRKRAWLLRQNPQNKLT